MINIKARFIPKDKKQVSRFIYHCNKQLLDEVKDKQDGYIQISIIQHPLEYTGQWQESETDSTFSLDQFKAFMARK